MPTEADQQSKGFMFVTLNNPAEAQAFQRAMHDLKFDKRHTFRVVPFTDIDKYEDLEETYKEPPTEEWKPRVRCVGARVVALREAVFANIALFFDRSTSVLGSLTLLVVINTSSTAGTTSRSRGTTAMGPTILLTSVR